MPEVSKVGGRNEQPDISEGDTQTMRGQQSVAGFKHIGYDD